MNDSYYTVSGAIFSKVSLYSFLYGQYSRMGFSKTIRLNKTKVI